MRYSKLFGKTIKNAPSDEVAVNAKLLTKAGFIRKEIAGVYNFLPLGLRVLNKISNIVREEMNAIGGQELELTTLQNKQSWEKTGRWSSFDVLFKAKSQLDIEYPLGPTHEEVIVPLAKQFVNSYKDLPLYVYQIQTKFRDEKRAQSGLLRGREFLMKDLYSFHTDEKDFEKYYEIAKKAYKKLFQRLGLDAIETQAGGGTFSKFSHEYQVVAEAGEDEIIYCPAFAKASVGKPGCHFSQNQEIAGVKENESCPICQKKLAKAKAIEVGNIFPLKTKFSETFGLTYKGKDGKENPVVMGCYGIGISRLMGTIAEVYNDEKGIIWPKSVAPYQVHLIMINDKGLRIKKRADEVYEKLQKAGIEVLYDDREDVSAGGKFADADLIGIPVRLVVSEKTGDKIEWKKRSEEKTEFLSEEELIRRLV
ncbi:MAG: aminoacyl--tRNA ligase-related protein [Candidatus Levybacteria bacterium]|nr:aminoacyl--tRNA ligase-related protein [Candidatus Levybacteria bacterium]